MSVNKAKNYYMGLEGFKRMNCALSVMSAFKEKFMLSEEKINSVRDYGSGKAPDGLCGAYYAATVLLKDEIEILEKEFKEKAGSIKCKEIKECRRLSCVGCVEHSARIIEEYSKNRVV